MELPRQPLLDAGLTEAQADAVLDGQAKLQSAIKAWATKPRCPIHDPWMCYIQDKGCTLYGEKEPTP